MNSKIIIGVVIVLVVGGGIFWYLSSRSTAPANNITASQSNQPTSLKALLAKNEAQECTFENSTDGTVNRGTVYFGRGGMRSDFVSVTGDQTSNAHMIVQDATVYLWMDGASSGFKTSIDSTAGTQTNNAQAIDLNQDVNYSCKPWSVDSGKFVLPTGIEFTDAGAMMRQQINAGVNANATANGASCSTCDQVPEGPAREQCKTALGC